MGDGGSKYRYKHPLLQQLKYFYLQSEGLRGRILLGMLLGLLNITLGLAFIYVSKDIVDVATGKLEGDMWHYVALLALLLTLRMAVVGWRQWVNGRTQQRLTNEMRSRLFHAVLNSPWHGREDRNSGDVMSRMSEDLRVVVACVAGELPATVVSVFQLLAACWVLFSLQPKLLLLLLLIFPVAMALSKVYYKTMRRLTKEVRTQESDIQSHVQESVQNRSLLLSLQRTGLMSSRLAKLQSKLLDTFSHRLRFSISTRILILGGFNIGYYTAFVWAAYGLMMGSVTYGMMTALLQLVAQVQTPILDLSTLFPSIVQACTAGERLQEISSREPMEKQPVEVEETPSAVDSAVGLSLEHVSYRYPDGDRDVLHDFSCRFVPGSRTAIIGPTGSGKSTLIRLLLGLLTPTDGKVKLLSSNGMPSSTYVRDHISYVPQGNSLLSGTIRQNLQLGKLDATDDEMREVLRRASALFVYDMPLGLDTVCGEKGSGLSEGQAQRIAIARALLQPGSILIMDEASSALDPNTERQILEELHQQQLGKTLIWVTHHMVVRDYMDQCLEVSDDCQ